MFGYIDEVFVAYESEDEFKVFDESKTNNLPVHNLYEDSYYDKEKEEYVLTGKGKFFHIGLIGLDDYSFNKYAQKVGLDKNKVEKSGILCDEYTYYEENKAIIERLYKYKKGDIIEGELGEKKVQIEIGSITDIKPYGYESTSSSLGFFVVNKDKYNDINWEVEEISIKSNNSEKTVEELKKLNIKQGQIIDFDEQAREERAMRLVVKIFLYGFITVITLIGVTNIFNTITSNMELRQREFASLKSIGMTKREFNRMINLETIFYSCKSLIYGIVLGLIGTFVLYRVFSIKIENGIYIPVKPILISIVSVFILVFVIMRYSISRINKQNTIETIRNENI